MVKGQPVIISQGTLVVARPGLASISRDVHTSRLDTSENCACFVGADCQGFDHVSGQTSRLPGAPEIVGAEHAITLGPGINLPLVQGIARQAADIHFRKGSGEWFVSAPVFFCTRDAFPSCGKDESRFHVRLLNAGYSISISRAGIEARYIQIACSSSSWNFAQDFQGMNSGSIW